jgi:beta-carotene 15,15'-dioxygenase
VLTALFLAADPLVGFAVYFGLWHSLAHLLVLADVLDTGGSRLALVRLVAPMTAISLLGLGVASVAMGAAGRMDLLVPVLFVGVSMLTVPHMVIVERMWRSRSSPRRVGWPR